MFVEVEQLIEAIIALVVAIGKLPEFEAFLTLLESIWNKPPAGSSPAQPVPNVPPTPAEISASPSGDIPARRGRVQ